jgi:N-dimethylarginine dimethylaminohydrolase
MTPRVGTTGGEAGRLRRVVVKSPADAFSDAATVARQWRDLNFTAAPDFAAAIDEHRRFCDLLASSGADVLMLPPGEGTGLDSIYVRDASLLSPQGVVLCRMGKPQRDGEPAAQRRALEGWGAPVEGAVVAPGCIEGGDVLWMDPRTVVVGRGYRTNDEGIRQYRAALGDGIDEMHVVPLPHWRGPGDVFHLMSIISPVDRDLAVVYAPLLPVPFREWLIARGVTCVEVPDEEFDSMGANVLALGPRDCVMVEGSPRTRAALERAGARVQTYAGREISLKGGGGPTCLTRPLWRHAAGRR